MPKIICIMGKSGSGKDTIFKKLIENNELNLKTVVSYTTRPIRIGEVDGQNYYFVDHSFLEQQRQAKKLIECRSYDTVHGIWNYFLIDDGQIDMQIDDLYIVIGTLESYQQMSQYFGEDIMVPIYVDVEDGLRLERALMREKQEEKPKYAELCRRFLADCEDFSESKLKECKISKFYVNISLEKCLQDIVSDIKQMINR